MARPRWSRRRSGAIARGRRLIDTLVAGGSFVYRTLGCLVNGRAPAPVTSTVTAVAGLTQGTPIVHSAVEEGKAEIVTERRHAR